MAMFNSYVKLPEGIYRMTMGQNLRHPIQNLPLDIFSSVVDFVATMFDPNYDLPLCQSAGWAPGEISGIHHPKKNRSFKMIKNNIGKAMKNDHHQIWSTLEKKLKNMKARWLSDPCHEAGSSPCRDWASRQCLSLLASRKLLGFDPLIVHIYIYI